MKHKTKHIIFLPATAPDDISFGNMPDKITSQSSTLIHHVYFPVEVWYNTAICKNAAQQIRKLHLSDITLIGFSKSGLGVWNIIQMLSDIITSSIIFDAPVAQPEIPKWNANQFFNQTEWQRQLPINNIDIFKNTMPTNHSLTLIAGPLFPGQMTALSMALIHAGIKHIFTNERNISHNWNSGWLEKTLAITN